jgi:hypothetical protein
VAGGGKKAIICRPCEKAPAGGKAKRSGQEQKKKRSQNKEEEIHFNKFKKGEAKSCPSPFFYFFPSSVFPFGADSPELRMHNDERAANVPSHRRRDGGRLLRRVGSGAAAAEPR